jgi:hypothetical protein
LSWPRSDAVLELVGEADGQALRAEATLLMPRGVETADYMPVAWTNDRRSLAATERWIFRSADHDDWIYSDSFWVREFVERVTGGGQD